MSLADLAPDLILGLGAGMALAALHLRWLWLASRRLGADLGLGGLMIGGALRLAFLVAGFAALGAVTNNPGVAMIAGLVGLALVRLIALRLLRGGRGS